MQPLILVLSQKSLDCTCQGSTALGVFLGPDGVHKNCRPELHSLSLPLFQEPEICHLPDFWMMRRYQLNHLGCLQLLVLSNQRWQNQTTPLDREKEDGSIGVTSKTHPLLEGLGCQRLQDTLQPCDGEILNKQGPRQPRANPLLEEAELLLTGQRCLVNRSQHLQQRSPESRSGIIIAGVNPH